MKPAPFAYHAPTTVDEAAGLLGELENVRLLAGGQSLLPMMNFRYVIADHIIDLNNIASLSYLRVGEEIQIGAMTRQRDLEFSDELKNACPIIPEALLHVGHRQTRNRGTIGGSLCHLDPSAELVALMTLLSARLSTAQLSGVREIQMENFALGYMTHALEPGELLTRISIPLWPDGHGYAFEEFARRHGDFAIAAVGVMTTLDPRGSILRLAVVISGLGPTPSRLYSVEKQVVGETPTADLIGHIAAAASETESFSDAHVTAEYRQHLAGVLCRRALKHAFDRALTERSLHDRSH